MELKFNIWITFEEKIDTKSLVKKLKKYNCKITQLGEAVYVSASLDSCPQTMEDFIDTCREFGECEVRVSMSRKKYW